MTGRCPRCRRTYELEPADDPGVCCICHRDDVMVARLGPTWRDRVHREQQARRAERRGSGVTPEPRSIVRVHTLTRATYG